MKTNKNVVRLTESQLKQMIAESVKNVLKEWGSDERESRQTNFKNGHYIEGMVNLNNGDILTVVELRSRIRGMARWGVYINDTPIGCFVNYSPILIDYELEPYVNEIVKTNPELFQHQFENGYIIDDDDRLNSYDFLNGYERP